MLGRRMMQEMLGHDPFDDFFRDPFMNDPFGGMGGMGGMRGGGNQLRLTDGTSRGAGNDVNNRSLMPFGSMGGNDMMPFGNMGGFGGMGMMGGMGGGGMMMMQSFSSDGNTVHHSSTQARMGPGGVTEIQRKVKDGRTGQEQIVLERRIGERGRRVEKSRNLHTGDEETVDNSYGIAEGLEDHFDREFEQVAGHSFAYNPQVNFIQQSAPSRVVQQGGRVQQQQPRVDYRVVPSGSQQRSNSQQRMYVQQASPQNVQYVQTAPRNNNSNYNSYNNNSVQYVQTAPRNNNSNFQTAPRYQQQRQY